MNNLVAVNNSYVVVSENHFVLSIDSTTLNCLDEIMNFVSKNMNFPNYFSNNLNSFEECLNDLEWLGEKKIILIVKKPNDLLKHEQPVIRTAFFDILFDWNKNFEKSFLILME